MVKYGTIEIPQRSESHTEIRVYISLDENLDTTDDVELQHRLPDCGAYALGAGLSSAEVTVNSVCKYFFLVNFLWYYSLLFKIFFLQTEKKLDCYINNTSFQTCLECAIFYLLLEQNCYNINHLFIWYISIISPCEKCLFY